MRRNPVLTKSTEEDHAYWQALADAIPGWQLAGWTYMTRATYVTPGHWGDYHTDTIEMTGRQRDDLLEAIKR